MKALIFSLLATVMVGTTAFASPSNANKSMRYILKNQAGIVYRVSHNLSSLTKADMNRLGVQLNKDCKKITESKHLQLSLELKTMMVSLSLRPDPKTLRLSEKNTLKKVPLCKPYLPMLKVLSQIISGDEYIGEKEVKITKK